MADVDHARARIDSLHQALAEHGLVHRAPPPEPTGCCGRGCNGCVWEGFYAALAWWEDDARQLLAAKA